VFAPDPVPAFKLMVYEETLAGQFVVMVLVAFIVEPV
jgi:hypothetical protein